jgi:ubiquinone biosynthesis protein UbiJ
MEQNASYVALPHGFWALVEDAAARLLARAPENAKYLTPIVGKVIRLEVEPLGPSVSVCPTESGLSFYDEVACEPDAIISGTPLAFMSMMLSASPQDALFSGRIRISGNADDAKRLQALLSRLEIDSEAHVSSLVGHTLSGHLFELLRSGSDWARDAIAIVQMDMGEYLQEESRHLPSSGEMEVYCGQVDELRADVERLEARIQRLQVRIHAPGGAMSAIVMTNGKRADAF